MNWQRHTGDARAMYLRAPYPQSLPSSPAPHLPRICLVLHPPSCASDSWPPSVALSQPAQPPSSWEPPQHSRSSPESGVSTVPDSAVSGNVGTSPATATSLTGFSLVQDPSKQFWTSTQVDGRLLTLAVLDMQTAFTDAMNRPLPDFVELKAGLIGGSILVPGLYKWTTDVTISTGITLAGGPADTWIFQISGTLVQAANVQMTLIGGAVSSNIIWAVAGTGNILAQTDVVLGTNAIDHGCIYAQTAVALQKATVLCSGGVVVTPPPTSSSASVTSAPASSSASPTSSAPSTTYSAKCTPTATPCYTTAFEDLDGSVHGDDYLSYILTDTVDECISFCACRPGCAFANPYYDNNGKNTTMLTCAIYAGCHTAADATNTGGTNAGGWQRLQRVLEQRLLPRGVWPPALESSPLYSRHHKADLETRYYPSSIWFQCRYIILVSVIVNSPIL
ncbi:hypothetical protein DFH09DRAFT_1312976 [Mycena vulgaris]|nr:hypothetical protein DFH09DRAFT_1312976 [Mycena vulgaris]